MEVDDFFFLQVKTSVDLETTVVRVLSREKLFCGRRKSWNAFQLNRNKWTLVNIQQFCPNFESNFAEFTITSPIWKHWQQILKLLHFIFSKLRISFVNKICFSEIFNFSQNLTLCYSKLLTNENKSFASAQIWLVQRLFGQTLLYIIYQTRCIGELFSNKLSEAWDRFSF